MNKSEEAAFWVLVALIDDGGILYRGMYSKNLAGCHVEMRSLEARARAFKCRTRVNVCRVCATCVCVCV